MARPKGSKNIRSFNAEILATELKCDPLKILMLVANGDWKALGYKQGSNIAYTNAGIEFEQPVISLSDRVQAAKDACKYLYSPKKQEVEHSGDVGFKIIIEDYLSKKDSE